MHTTPLRPFPKSVSLPSSPPNFLSIMTFVDTNSDIRPIDWCQSRRKTHRKALTSRSPTSSRTNETSSKTVSLLLIYHNPPINTTPKLTIHIPQHRKKILLETIAQIESTQTHPIPGEAPPPPPPPPPPPSNTAAIYASLRTRWQPYSSKPLALSETKFPPPHRSGPSASSGVNSEDITPAHLIDEAICRLEQYERHAKPALDKYYAVKQRVAAAAAAAAGPAQPDPASAGAGAGMGTGKGREEPVQKNELDVSRDPRLRRWIFREVPHLFSSLLL